MACRTNIAKIIGFVAAVLFFYSPASAQLAGQLSAYTGVNASGYLGPLVDAFGADLNAATFHSARVPRSGLHLSLEIRFTSVRFADADRKFAGRTEGDFRPVTVTDVPTVIGDKGAVYVDGDGSTRFAFPGGFDIASFSVVVPQLRIGSLYGTEALLRYFYFNMTEAEFGVFNLYGFGLRHSISQYMYKSIPVDMALSIFWQQFSLDNGERGDDLVVADALTVGLHASKRFDMFEPYVGITYDRFKVDVNYESENELDSINLSFDSDDALHLTFGLSCQVAFITTSGEYNFGNQNAYSVGVAFQFSPIQ